MKNPSYIFSNSYFRILRIYAQNKIAIFPLYPSTIHREPGNHPNSYNQKRSSNRHLSQTKTASILRYQFYDNYRRNSFSQKFFQSMIHVPSTAPSICFNTPNSLPLFSTMLGNLSNTSLFRPESGSVAICRRAPGSKEAAASRRSPISFSSNLWIMRIET